MHKKTASEISAAPLSLLRSFGLKKKGGIIRIYNSGFLKWLIPARKYNAAIRYKCHGKTISAFLRLG
jgi:hypothetical protein